MSDERRQQPTVNLQELERQLREAARARQRAHATAEALLGVPQERQTAQPIPNPPSHLQSGSYQQSLPLASPAQPQAPMPQPPMPQASPSSVYRAPQPPPAAPQAYPASAYQSSNYQSPNYQSAGYQAQNPDPRERGPQYGTSQEPSRFDEIIDEFEDETSVLKTDRMDDVYPAYDQGRSRAVADEQFFAAAAYEEPAANAYDRYTEDQFPKIEHEQRSGGLARFAVWFVIIAIIGTGGYFAYPLVRSVFLPGEQAGKAPPLIKADPKPVKVAPEAQPQDQAGVQKDILSKHANESPASARIAPQPEQPVDIGNAAQAGARAQANAQPPLVPLVPGTGEPRIVKTVTVRADGTIIPEKSDPELAAKAMPQGAPALAASQPIASMVETQPAAPSAEPSSGLPPLPEQPAGVSSEFSLEGGIPVPPERLAEADAALTLPQEQDAEPAASAAPAPTAPGKNFGVQFGAPETEAKGNELKALVERQFASVLSGGTVGVFRGENNGRVVFRVRAVGYSRDEANAVCQRVTSTGGQCFVSPNS